MKNQTKNRTFLMVGVLFGILLEFFLTGFSYCTGKWNDSTSLDLENLEKSGQIELTNCSFEDGTLVSRAGDAMLIFHGVETWGQMQLLFEEGPANAATVEWYDSPAQEDTFDRFRRQEAYLLPNSFKARIVLPVRERGNFRLNIHGNFRLSGLDISRRVSLDSLSFGKLVSHLQVIRMVVLMLFGFLGSWLYEKEQSSKRKKHKNLQGAKAESTEGRLVYLDAIRVLAAVLVIVVHVIEPLTLLYPMGSKKYIFLETLSAMSLSCNLLFVMISGALLLPWKEESWSAFLKKRFLKVLVPLAVYGLLYIRGCCISEAGTGTWIRYAARTLVSGQFIKGPHLWLIYVLLGLYVTVIPLRHMLKNMQEKAEKALTLLIFVCLSVNTYAALTGAAIGIQVFLGDWSGVFVLGYMLNRNWMRRYDRVLVGFGLAAVGFSAVLTAVRQDCMKIIANQSVLSALMACAVFVVLLRMDAVLRPVGRWLAAASRYSYSMILVHWYVLIRIVYNGWFDSGMNQCLQVMGPILLCAALSVVYSWVIDRMIVDVLMGYGHFRKSVIR